MIEVIVHVFTRAHMSLIHFKPKATFQVNLPQRYIIGPWSIVVVAKLCPAVPCGESMVWCACAIHKRTWFCAEHFFYINFRLWRGKSGKPYIEDETFCTSRRIRYCPVSYMSKKYRHTLLAEFSIRVSGNLCQGTKDSAWCNLEYPNGQQRNLLVLWNLA